MANTQMLNRLSFFARFVERLERVTAEAKLYRFALRETARFFGASEACVALRDRVADSARIEAETKQKKTWDLNLFVDFIKNRRPAIPADLILAPLRVRTRIVGLIAIRREEQFAKGDGKFLCRLADRVSSELTAREELRLLTVRARISKDILRGLRPKDVLYKLLDGLEELLRYDQSAAILFLDGEKNAFKLRAEKITWRKAKSDQIGLELPSTAKMNRLLLKSNEPFIFTRSADGEWLVRGLPDYLDVVRILDYNRDRPVPLENSILCAALRSQGELLGLLKISSRVPEAFDEEDVRVVREFLPQANAAIRASQFSQTLHRRTIQSEKRLGILEIARGVAHDVNNALGAILPLAQAIISDTRDACSDPDEFLKDMLYIEENVKLCARIFGSMLGYAKTEEAGQFLAVDIKKSISAGVRLLERGLRTKGISVEMDIEEGLPTVEANPNRLQQVFFNLITNARDAMPDGGSLNIKAWRDSKAIHLSFQDTGVGIKKENIKRVMEPFFTTKKDGTGLGLSICRSILWESNGKIRVESEPGKGTTVFVVFPTPYSPSEENKSGTN
jgi:two-component system NtrC family sensor kinase